MAHLRGSQPAHRVGEEDVGVTELEVALGDLLDPEDHGAWRDILLDADPGSSVGVVREDTNVRRLYPDLYPVLLLQPACVPRDEGNAAFPPALVLTTNAYACAQVSSQI